MTATPLPSKRQRFVMPVLAAVIVWLTADILLFALMGSSFASSSLYKPVLNLLSAVRFLLLLVGSLVLYPILYFRGASWSERVWGCLTLPLVYLFTAVFRATAYFPIGQAIYYGFNPLTFGSASIQVGLMGLMEMVCRTIARRRTQLKGPIVQTHLIASILIGSAALYVTLLWDGGVHWFYVYQQGYRLLFQ